MLRAGCLWSIAVNSRGRCRPPRRWAPSSWSTCIIRKSTYITQPLLMHNVYCKRNRILLYEDPVIRGSCYTRILLYEDPVIRGSCYTRILLSCYPVILLYEDPVIRGSCYPVILV
jgi:hypothetical protein